VGWLCFDADSSGIARTEAAQLIAYWSGIVFPVEELLPLVIGRLPAVATVIPAGDPRIGSGSKCNAIGHSVLPSAQRGCCSVPCKIPTLAPRHRTVWAKKGHMCGNSDRASCRELRRKSDLALGVVDSADAKRSAVFPRGNAIAAPDLTEAAGTPRAIGARASKRRATDPTGVRVGASTSMTVRPSIPPERANSGPDAQ
jgi:hypothetical protein